MLSTMMAGLRTHARRMIATMLAVTFGVAFVAGTLIFGSTAQAGFYQTYARVAANVDADVQPSQPHHDAGAPRLLTPAQVAQVSSVAGASSVDARMQAPLPLVGANGQLVTNFDQAGITISTDGPARLRPYDVTGALPTAPNQAALDGETAAHQHKHIGDQITVVDHAGARHSYQLVGLLDFGTSKQYSGESVVGLPTATITALTGVTGFHEIAIGAAPGTSPATLVTRIRRALGGGPKVITGDQDRTELANDATSIAFALRTVLLVFGVVSLIVAAFVIYNTFAILLAQRVRETALLRLVGATRRQVFTSVIAESAVIGVIGGVLGVAVGAGVAAALIALLNGLADAGIPGNGIVIGLSPIIVGLLLGIVVTVAAALVPAIRATRTSPLATLRDVPTAKTASRRVRMIRAACAVAVAAIGAALTALGSHAIDGQGGSLEIVAGGIVVFLAILIAGPLYIGPMIAAIGTLPATVFGTSTRLAVANSRRNPGRTAVTAATLIIGVGIMALFSVVFASVRTTADRQITGHFPIDYAVSGVSYGHDQHADIPPTYAGALRSLPQFPNVAEVRIHAASLDRTTGRIAAIDPAALRTFVKPRMISGNIGDMRAGTIVVSSANKTARVGDTITVTAGGHTAALRVVGIAQTTVPAAPEVDAFVSWDQLVALAGPGNDTVVMAKAGPGVSAVASRAALDRVTASYPLLTVDSIADLRQSLDSSVNGLLALFGGLIATAVLIALFGIANTLSLSVVERTRESATVRALGLTRSQLCVSLIAEALLLGAVGAIVGVVLGLIFGPLLVRELLTTIGPTVAIPWSWIAGLIVLTSVAAAGAAVIPARRAAGLSITSAMAES